MMPPTKFCHMTQIILWLWSCDQSLVTLAFVEEKLSLRQFYKDLTEKLLLLRGGLGSSSIIWDWY